MLNYTERCCDCVALVCDSGVWFCDECELPCDSVIDCNEWDKQGKILLDINKKMLDNVYI